MKLKIVVKVHMTCAKCRQKALKIAATSHGVDSVTIQGADKDQLLVTGDGTDPIKLTKLLRKKFQCATIVTVEEDKPKKKEDKPPANPSPPPPSGYHYEYYPSVPVWGTIDDPRPSENNCPCM